MNKALIDTDIFSEMTKGVDQTVVANARSYRKAFGHYTISAITFMEMIRGYQKKQASRQLQAFLAGIASEEVIPFDQAAAELADCCVSRTLPERISTIGRQVAPGEDPEGQSHPYREDDA